MRGLNVCFNSETGKIALNYPCYPFISGALCTFFITGMKGSKEPDYSVMQANIGSLP